MKVMKMRAVRVTFGVIFLIAIFPTSSSDNPFAERNYLEYNCSGQELTLKLSTETIEPNFISSPFLTCLSLPGNQIQSVRKGAFDSVPTLEYLNMAGNSLTNDISFGGHENLKTLILANQSSILSQLQHSTRSYDYYDYGHNVKYVDSNKVLKIAGSYPQLRYLDLSGNEISSILWRMYTNLDYPNLDMQIINVLPKLEYLDLSHNVIENFYYYDNHSFFNLNLTHLFLHSNNLNRVNLQYLQNLIVLTADGNNIRTLEQNYCDNLVMCVRKMPRLKYLSVSNNELFRIHRDFFEFMPELAMLNLSSNKLTDGICGVFNYLISLEDLNIDNNKLTNISLFKNLSRLSSLSLNQNNIKYIDSKDLMNTPHLRKLYLNHNKITNIHKNAFLSLDLLEELHLASNNLNNLPKKWSNNLRNLRYLDLTNNEFTHLESLSLSHKSSLVDIYLINNNISSFPLQNLCDLPINGTIYLAHNERKVELDPSVL